MNDKLTTIQQSQIDPYRPDSFERALVVCENIAKSRLFGIPSKEAAFVILATGNELGLSPMQSLRGIHIIEGRPSPSADAVVAIILRSGQAEYFREVETTDDKSTWETCRRGSKRQIYTYTISDAQSAGLVKPNSNWMKYRKRMLAARAKAFLGRDVYPDILLGLITQEEMQEPTFEPSNGEVIDAPVIQAETVDAVKQLVVDISNATIEQLPALANAVRESYPKGHPDRELLASALSARKAEMSRAS